MPKSRDIAYLLEMLKGVNKACEEQLVKQHKIRREIYPAEPPNGYDRHWSRGGWRVATFIKPDDKQADEYTLLVIHFNYTDYYGKITDSWSSSWYKGPEDERLWKEAHGPNGAAWPGNEMEQLAWEGVWPEYVGIQHSDKALSYRRAEDRIRRITKREGIIRKRLEDIVSASLIEQNVNRYADQPKRQGAGPRILLGGSVPMYFEGNSLRFGEMAKTYTVPLEATLPNDDSKYGYGEGSNASLKHKLYMQRTKGKKNGR